MSGSEHRPVPVPPDPSPAVPEPPAAGGPTPPTPTPPPPAPPPPAGPSTRPVDRKPDAPRRVRNGVKLRHRDQSEEGRSDLACSWLALLHRCADETIIADGWEYALAGQVATLEIDKGEVRAKVQGRAPRPYQTVLAVPQLTGGQWDRVIAAMAQEAMFAAQLLENRMPAHLDRLFEQLDLDLLSPEQTQWRSRCTCEAPAPCKHAAAVAIAVGDRLEETPQLVFCLRGMQVSRLVERLRQTRAMQTRGVAAAHADPLIPASQVEPPPLESCLEDFWRAPSPLTADPPTPYAEHALLRRLGPSPLTGRFPLVGLLASVYDTVAATAVRLRDHAEHIDEIATEPTAAPGSTPSGVIPESDEAG